MQKPLVASLFALFFALSAGLVWEIYEFAVDGFLGMNMQKFALKDGTELLGRLALMDTMVDLVVDAVGALVVAVAFSPVSFVTKFKNSFV